MIDIPKYKQVQFEEKYKPLAQSFECGNSYIDKHLKGSAALGSKLRYNISLFRS